MRAQQGAPTPCGGSGSGSARAAQAGTSVTHPHPSTRRQIISGPCIARPAPRSAGVAREQQRERRRRRQRTCSMPFIAHQVQNQTREVENPKAMLSAAVAMRPPASSRVGEVRDPSTPLTNLLRAHSSSSRSGLGGWVGACHEVCGSGGRGWGWVRGGGEGGAAIKTAKSSCVGVPACPPPPPPRTHPPTRAPEPVGDGEDGGHGADLRHANGQRGVGHHGGGGVGQAAGGGGGAGGGAIGGRQRWQGGTGRGHGRREGTYMSSVIRKPAPIPPPPHHPPHPHLLRVR